MDPKKGTVGKIHNIYEEIYQGTSTIIQSHTNYKG